MGSWKNARMITTCPECESAPVRLAKGAGRTAPENRIYHCPRCHAVFTHDELTIHYPRKNQRPKLEVMVSFGGWTKVKPIGHISEDYV